MALCLMAGVASPGWAGGHFDMDDAGTLPQGHCQYEAWANRARSGTVEPLTGLHFGSACRVGAVELGLNFDQLSGQGDRSILLGPQLKWTFIGDAGRSALSAAVSVSAGRDLDHGGRTGGQAIVPVTWHVVPTLQIDTNLGYDWSTGNATRTSRFGSAVEWSLNNVVELIAERDRAFDQWTSRIGFRFSVAPLTTLDVSIARTGPNKLRTVTLGLNREFSQR